MMNRVFFDKHSYLKISPINKLALTAVFIILGILIPFITGHMFLMPGTIFLPMHIPVLLCGIITGCRYGALCGIMTPILSSLLTGMPSFYPMLPIMLIELTAYGFISGLLTNNLRINIFFALPISMIIGRLCYAFMFLIITHTASKEVQALSAWGAFITGLPGIAVQIIIIPTIYFVLRKGVLSKYMRINKIFLKAIELIETNEASLVLVKAKQIVYQDIGKGVSPLVKLYEENSELLEGAYVFDKVIGKGAAIIIVKGKAKGLYGLLGSSKARAFLEDKNIKYAFKKEVPTIRNNTNTDICPIEQIVIDEFDLEIGYNKIKVRLDELRRNHV